MTTQAALSVALDLQSDALSAQIVDRRPETLAIFAPLSEPQRDGFLIDVWTIGMRTLINAHRYAEESRLADVGQQLVDDVDQHLRTYVERQQEGFVKEMKRYFDPR